jgi:hypothetical protein
VTEALSIPQKKSDPGLLRGPTYTARGLHPIVLPSWFHNMTSVADIKRRAIAAPVQIGKLSSVRCGFSADVAGSVHGAFCRRIIPEKSDGRGNQRIKWMFTTEKARAKMGRAYPDASKES